MFDGILRIAPHRLYILQADPWNVLGGFHDNHQANSQGAESVLQLSNDLRQPVVVLCRVVRIVCATMTGLDRRQQPIWDHLALRPSSAPYVMSLQIRQAFFRCERSRSAAALTLAVGTSRHLKPNGSTAAGIPIFRVVDNTPGTGVLNEARSLCRRRDAR